MTQNCALAVRGPKKKKGGSAVEAPLNSDIVNIWKDRKDPSIQVSDVYPPWLMEMIKVKYTPDDIMWQMYRGERMPNLRE